MKHPVFYFVGVLFVYLPCFFNFLLLDMLYRWVTLFVIPFFIFLPCSNIPPMDQGLLIIEASRSHSDTPHSVGYLWNSDLPDAETSTWQHTTLTTNIHALGGIRTHNPSKRAAADPRLRPRRHWVRLIFRYVPKIKLYCQKSGLMIDSLSPVFVRSWGHPNSHVFSIPKF